MSSSGASAEEKREAELLGELLAVVQSVVDPEIPVLTIADLGVLRGVEVDGAGRVTVTITPTYSGCPAMQTITDDILLALAAAGYADAAVQTALAPAWTTDWMSEEGRRKLADYGIAPPSGAAPATGASGASGARGASGADDADAGPVPVPVALSVRCPQCRSADTREVSRFGSTACKSLWTCRSCLEPFDHFKVI